MSWTHMAHRSVATVLLLLVAALVATAQQDQEVRAKQTDLKNQYNDTRQKQQIIKDAAADKSRASGRRRSRAITTGYDYTQVKGYLLTGFNERLDQLFKRASDLGMIEGFRLDGTFPVPNRRSPGSMRTVKATVYYVEATPEEKASGAVNDFDIIEIRMEKEEQIPPEDMPTDDAGGDVVLPEGGGIGETNDKPFSLAGMDLWTLIDAVDAPLYDDVLMRRSLEPSVQLPTDLFSPKKRGPFIVMTDKDLRTSTARFNVFYNEIDTLESAVLPPTMDATGPFFTGKMPVMYPEDKKVLIKNPDAKKTIISKVTFAGPNAEKFRVKGPKLPFLMAEKGAASDSTKLNIEFDYIGQSPYETRTEMVVETDQKQAQTIDVYANPGVFPTDVFVLDASLDRIELRSPSRSSFAPDWKLLYTVGNPELNMPRSLSSISSIGIGFRNDMSVGVVLPMKLDWSTAPAPLAFKNNLLSSPSGYNFAFNFTFGFPFALGGNVVITNDFDKVTKYDHLALMPNIPVIPGQKDYGNDFFHIGSAGQVFYPIMFKDRESDPSFLFKLDIGAGFIQIKRDHLIGKYDSKGDFIPYEKEGLKFTAEDQGKMITLGKEKDLFDVYFRIGFINLAAKNNYGIGLQYFNGGAMADAWLELTNWLRVEMKYSFLLREKEIWEAESNCFLVTPRFRLGIPSIFN